MTTSQSEATADNKRLEAALGYRFSDPALLTGALCHSSYVNEQLQDNLESNERLEFLGDAVLNLAVSHLLMQRYPDLAEGELSRNRAHLVNETQLAAIARGLALGSHLLLGKGEALTGGREKNSLLADAVEAVTELRRERLAGRSPLPGLALGGIHLLLDYGQRGGSIVLEAPFPCRPGLYPGDQSVAAGEQQGVEHDRDQRAGEDQVERLVMDQAESEPLQPARQLPGGADELGQEPGEQGVQQGQQRIAPAPMPATRARSGSTSRS